MAKPPAIIVDRNDNTIGAKDRHKRSYDDIYRVACLWLTNSAGDILLAQRSFNKDRGAGKWATAAAGTVEVGETYESNIYKEAEEEIGLTGVTFTPARKVFIDEPNEFQFFCQYFTGVADWPLERFRLQTEEVEAIRWVTPAQLRAELTSASDPYVRSVRFWRRLGFI